MSLLTCASGKSVYRGYDYYSSNKVNVIEKVGDGQYKGFVDGSGNEPYEVFIDVNHPRKSHCNCPHANGKRIVCKHQMAMFFKAFPDEAKRYKTELEEYWDYEEKRHEDEEYAISEFLEKCDKSELADIIWQMLFDGPEWQYERFVREYLDI
ncbi:MAG: SWIM zinc finger family protein [Ruminococcus sp.]|nr:SWIM zinc finger family protein [Ruminococcus sp.]